MFSAAALVILEGSVEKLLGEILCLFVQHQCHFALCTATNPCVSLSVKAQKLATANPSILLMCITQVSPFQHWFFSSRFTVSKS